MNVSVILVHYHTPQLLAAAVKALRADLDAIGLEAELIAVDNGSRESDRAIMENLPLRLLKPGKNLGYAGGVNIGAAAAQADILVMMNPDVEVFPGCLKTLINALQDGAAAAGPRFYWDREKNFMLPPTEKRSRRDELFRRLASRSDSGARRARKQWRSHARKHWLAERRLMSESLSGALLVVRRDAWEEVGPFDEEFKLYFEETDWLMRLKRKGLRAVYVPDAEAVHFYNQSAALEPSAPEWFAQSAARFERRYYGAWFCALLNGFATGRESDIKVPPLLSEDLPMIDLVFPDKKFERPLWIEISPSPLLFPAAAAIIDDTERRTWSLPTEVWQYLSPGTYFLQVVDGAGREIARYRFNRPGNIGFFS